MSDKKEQSTVAAAFGQMVEMVIYAENPAAVEMAERLKEQMGNSARIEIRPRPAPLVPGSYGK